MLRLSSRAHWDVPVRLPGGGTLHLLASDPTPPLFDGAEGFNRKRNHDEVAFWTAYLDGTAFRDDEGRSAPAPAEPLVVLGDLGIDPHDGAGLKDGIAGLLAHPRLADPLPSGDGGAAAAGDGANAAPAGARRGGHRGLARRSRTGKPAGRLCPAVARPRGRGQRDLWPAPGAPLAEAVAAASAHRLVWIDVALP